MADDLPKLSFRYHQSGADPAFNLISVAPSLHISTDRLHNREGRFDHVRAGEGSTELLGHAQFVNGERFLQSLLQATGGTRIDIHEFAMQTIQGALGVAVVDHRVGVLHLPLHIGLVLLRKMVNYISFLVNLASLDECGFAGVVPHGRRKRLATIQDIEMR